MKRILSLLLAAALMVPLAACSSGGEKQEDAPITSLGWFLLERKAGEELDDLTDQETYLIHIYDIVPDESENVEPSPFESSYSVTLNEANTYEPLAAHSDDVRHVRVGQSLGYDQRARYFRYNSAHLQTFFTKCLFPRPSRPPPSARTGRARAGPPCRG